jgi:glycosyltransferase involved in cell wall biosynthesis
VIKKTILTKENHGKWYALNKGISESSGELVTLQDADDVSCPGRIARQLEVLQEHRSLHNLCLFHHCYTQEDIDRYKNTIYGNNFSRPPSIGHEEVRAAVWKGFNTPGINHYAIPSPHEAHGATCLFYRQLWKNGMKFLPGNMGLRCQKAEDSDFNTKMTLLLQKTSILLEKQYLYRRNTSTNNAWLEGL